MKIFVKGESLYKQFLSFFFLILSIKITELTKMSDDEDYMSDKFLELSEKCPTPSLVYRHTDKRQFELEKRKAEHEAKMREKNKSIHLIEREKREEGMSNAITSSNKGEFYK